MRKALFILFIAIFSLQSCVGDDRNKVMGDELTVYFVQTSDEALAGDVAKYWKDNDFLTGQPQDLELDRDENGFVLRMIASETLNVDQISFEESQMLKKLEDDLKAEVFSNKPLKLEVCNKKFERIYDVN